MVVSLISLTSVQIGQQINRKSEEKTTLFPTRNSLGKYNLTLLVSQQWTARGYKSTHCFTMTIPVSSLVNK